MSGGVELRGGCHCGAIAVHWSASRPAEAFEVRACACSFCRGHGARTATDPGGFVRFVEREPGALNRYRFATRSADFLLCARCGTYVGAFVSHDDRGVATVNVNALAARAAFAAEARAVDYTGQSEEDRRARRLRSWTPAEIVTA